MLVKICHLQHVMHFVCHKILWHDFFSFSCYFMFIPNVNFQQNFMQLWEAWCGHSFTSHSNAFRTCGHDIEWVATLCVNMAGNLFPCVASPLGYTFPWSWLYNPFPCLQMHGNCCQPLGNIWSSLHNPLQHLKTCSHGCGGFLQEYGSLRLLKTFWTPITMLAESPQDLYIYLRNPSLAQETQAGGSNCTSLQQWDQFKWKKHASHHIYL